MIVLTLPIETSNRAIKVTDLKVNILARTSSASLLHDGRKGWLLSHLQMGTTLCISVLQID